jgi:hypothetical protein
VTLQALYGQTDEDGDVLELMLEAADSCGEIEDDEAGLQCVLSTAGKATDGKVKDRGRYTFLTEADFVFEGNFSKRHWDSEGNEITGEPGAVIGGQGGHKLPPLQQRSPLPPLNKSSEHVALTLDEAEEESKANIRALGQGDFSRGKVPMWAT